MDKKDLISHINNFMIEKGFKLFSKTSSSSVYVCETKDLFLRVRLDHSSYYESKYLRYNFGIKELCGNHYDESNPLIFTFYVALEMGCLNPCDYDAIKLKKELSKKYEKFLHPLIENGMNYICSSKSLIGKTPTYSFRKEVLEFINNYKVKHNIK